MAAIPAVIIVRHYCLCSGSLIFSNDLIAKN